MSGSGEKKKQNSWAKILCNTSIFPQTKLRLERCTVKQIICSVPMGRLSFVLKLLLSSSFIKNQTSWVTSNTTGSDVFTEASDNNNNLHVQRKFQWNCVCVCVSVSAGCYTVSSFNKAKERNLTGFHPCALCTFPAYRAILTRYILAHTDMLKCKWQSHLPEWGCGTNVWFQHNVDSESEKWAVHHEENYIITW